MIDFFQLHAIAAQLDLVVGSPSKAKQSCLLVQRHEVTSAVEYGAIAIDQWILAEPLCGFLEIIEIAQSHARSTQPQFTNIANGDRLQLFVQNPVTETRIEAAQRSQSFGGIEGGAGNLKATANAASLCGAVAVDELRLSDEGLVEAAKP